MRFADLLVSELAGIVELSESQIDRLLGHYQLLERWNQRLNLTSIRNMEDAVVRHYCECLFFSKQMPSGGKVLDFGSGAGFPGVPLAILIPTCEVTLAESHQRKAVFLRESSRDIGNISVAAKRAEDLPGGYDWIVSRAVNPSTVVDHARTLGKSVGLMVGKSDVGPLLETRELTWLEPVAIPWGEERVCLYGCFT